MRNLPKPKPSWGDGYRDALTWVRLAITELPAGNATGSRDFGLGYAQAVRDMLAVIDNGAMR